MKNKVAKLRTQHSSSLRVVDLGELVYDILKFHDGTHQRRPEPKAGMKSIFPLPAAEFVDGLPNHDKFLQGLIVSLNHLYGVPHAVRGTKTSRLAVENLKGAMDRASILNAEIPPLNFTEFFATRSLDYCGEEIKVARTLRWENIALSLPNEVGQLDIRDFCQGGVAEYVNNFEHYLIPTDEMVLGKPPRVIVEPENWDEIAEGLIQRGLCHVLRESELFHVKNEPLKSGMFSVTKNEFINDVEVCRLIMNFKPLNSLCLGLTGDTPTLPSITSMSSFCLDQDEVLCTTSEDVRCFFYLFQVPRSWWRFMSFNKAVPTKLTPPEFGDERGFLCSKVLPMGFVNSVAIAQHIHRRVVMRAMGTLSPVMGGELEIRRDRTASNREHLFRIYLDNFDSLERLDKVTADAVKGTPSEVAKALRETYLQEGLPRHPKKAVERQLQAEVQGAWIDGIAGTVTAKPAKIGKYAALALEVLFRAEASQRELQVIGGGFVYIAMFKRQMLCGLNQIWQTIVKLEGRPPKQPFPLPREVACEIVRFLGLLPLAYIDMRLEFDSVVSVSDASTSGGGFCVSKGLSPYGLKASGSSVRGDLVEPLGQGEILSIGLFDGIGALRVALDNLGVPVAGHISVEISAEARRVVESFFPDTLGVDSVEEVDEAMVKEWSLRFSNVALVIIGAGPPCQGVSGLNSDRKGALKDQRSALFKHVPRVVGLVRTYFPWAQTHSLSESVASMDYQDCVVMSDAFGSQPWFIDSAGMALCHRPRLYWVSWEIPSNQDICIGYGSDGRLPLQGEVWLECQVDPQQYLEKGWQLSTPGKRLPTFTTSRPTPQPLRRPAGLRDCAPHELQRWKADSHRFPPYQYMDTNCLHAKNHEPRPPSVNEREAIMGFPVGYTSQCMKKGDHGTIRHRDCRLTLIGNSWCVPVVSWLLSTLLHTLGFGGPWTVQDIVDRLTPGQGVSLQSILLRPPLQHSTSTFENSAVLTQKLSSLVSLKGEDLLLQGPSEAPVRFHRLRSSVPSKVWRWKVIAGWQWRGSEEHINVLELRAVLTTLKWRLEVVGQKQQRFIHLVDSLVCLHALTRGRSSSRKLRRTLMRINSLLLVTGAHMMVGYVQTDQNPADRPSRRGVRKKWVKRAQR